MADDRSRPLPAVAPRPVLLAPVVDPEQERARGWVARVPAAALPVVGVPAVVVVASAAAPVAVVASAVARVEVRLPPACGAAPVDAVVHRSVVPGVVVGISKSSSRRN